MRALHVADLERLPVDALLPAAIASSWWRGGRTFVAMPSMVACGVDHVSRVTSEAFSVSAGREQDRARTIDGRTFSVVPTPRRIDLKTAEQCRAELARLYREARGGKVAMGDATRLAYMLAQLGRLIELADLERRLAALEEKHGE